MLMTLALMTLVLSRFNRIKVLLIINIFANALHQCQNLLRFSLNVMHILQTLRNAIKNDRYFTVFFWIKLDVFSWFQVIASNKSKHRFIAASSSNRFQCYWEYRLHCRLFSNQVKHFSWFQVIAGNESKHGYIAAYSPSSNQCYEK